MSEGSASAEVEGSGSASEELGEVADEELEEESEDAEHDEVIESKPLSRELTGECLSLLCKIGSGLAHAYIRFDAKDKGLTDILVLQDFKHVRYVDISGNAVEDITCISSLPHLLTIKADHNRLTSAHLMELQYLQIASFAHNHITSTDGIAHPMLEVLDLSSNRITELTGLNNSNLPSLRVLDLHANRLESITGIHLPILQKLYAASNKLTRCDGIQGLQQLTTLHLRENSIAILDDFVPNLTALQYLNLRANAIENFSQITRLKCLPLLRALVLADTPASELEDYRVEVCIALRQLERLDKEEFTEDERADAEELQQQRQQEEDVEDN